MSATHEPEAQVEDPSTKSDEPPPGNRPLLFVAMPFGTKPDPTGRITIDFDDIYARAIRPAADDAKVEVIRADEERGGHVRQRERLLRAGHPPAARPRSTILMFAAIAAVPFDVAPIRSVPYKVTKKGKLKDGEAEKLR